MKNLPKLIIFCAALGTMGLAVAADKKHDIKTKNIELQAKTLICADSLQNNIKLTEASLNTFCQQDKEQTKVKKTLETHQSKSCKRGDHIDSMIKHLEKVKDKENNPLIQQALSTKLATDVQLQCKHNG